MSTTIAIQSKVNSNKSINTDLEVPEAAPDTTVTTANTKVENDETLQNDPMSSAIGDSYATRRDFFIYLSFALLLGAGVGAVAFCFLDAISNITDIWEGHDKSAAYDGFPNNNLGDNVSGIGKGRLWWLGVMSGGGFVLGVFKVLIKYPEGQAKSFIQEIKAIHVDPWEGISTTICGFISLCAGASVGPEAPMASLGGAAGHFISQRLGFSEVQTEVLTLIGMSSAFGALFPSPFLAMVLLAELAPLRRKRVMEVYFLTFAAAVVSFAVYISCATDSSTYLDPNLGPNYPALYTVGWDLQYLAQAIPLGFVSAILGMLTMVLRAVFGRIVKRFHFGVSPRHPIALILTPTIGGLLLGAIAIFCPLTVGDGSVQLSSILADGYSSYWTRQSAVFGTSPQQLQQARLQMEYLMTTGSISSGWPNPTPGDRIYDLSLLFATMFMKMLTFAISHSFGFVGGIIFPLFLIGATAGNLAAQITGINQTFAGLVMMVSVPSCVAPVPLLFLLIAVLAAGTTAYQTGAIFVGIMVSNLTVTGSGVLLALLRKPLPIWAESLSSIKEEEKDVRE